MAAVPDKVLQWLYSVIRNEYHDIERTYNDAATVLASYASLSPRTEVYTFENGSSALLLLISGTIPVDFRGQMYRFPLAIWTPHTYPNEGPIVFVKPTAGMVIRAGQHVALDGRIYHPYLAQWGRHWDASRRERSSLNEFIAILQDVFAKDPPVMSQQQAHAQRLASQQSTASPPPPPRPPSIYQSTVNSPHQPGSDAPPRLPPKGESLTTPTSRYDRPAPLPPPPQEHKTASFQPLPTWQHVSPGAQQYHSPHLQRQSADLRYSHEQYQFAGQSPNHPNRDSWQAQQSSLNHSHGPNQQYSQDYQQQVPPPASYLHGNPSYLPYDNRQSGNAVPNNHPHPSQSQQPFSTTQQFHPGQHSVQQPKQAPIDLLTSPLDVTLPSQNGNLEPFTAPPIPPNPEKDALLHALSQTLSAQTQRTLDSNKSAIQPLLAQQQALLHAQTALSSELDQLRQLDNVLDTNERVLTKAMHDAEQVMRAASSQRRPQVDEILVCPTVVGSQLYNLVAEQKGCEEARLMLIRGLDRGRVGTDVFVKMMRSLAREEFLKKALLRKAARGMGLDEKRWQVG